ncbi:unnamed protein product [Pieris brassicae]|uniref:Uncharacterized protein n=1 Tax=Pieris brassicae TaxID=7116 RepID=A0A9P0TI35_PIEBR|nr:unnamed protein product [Pieris brassicae]
MVPPNQRRKRRTWVKNWLMKRHELSHMNVMRHLEADEFRNFLRMDSECFEELLNMVTPLIQKQDTVMREFISPRERLTVTLRFLATGQSYEDLKFSAVISPQLMSTMIPETCSAIYKCLKHFIKIKKSFISAPVPILIVVSLNVQFGNSVLRGSVFDDEEYCCCLRGLWCHIMLGWLRRRLYRKL